MAQHEKDRGRQSSEAMEHRGESMAPSRAWEPMARWSPFGRIFPEFEWMLDRMGFDRLVDRMEGRFGRVPRLDMQDTEREIVLIAEMPGIDPKDVHVECRDNVLTLRGESRDERAEGGEEGERYSSYASYFRRLTLPPDVDVDRAEASFKHGVLRIRLPKREAAANVKRIPVSPERGAEQTASKPIEKGKAA